MPFDGAKRPRSRRRVPTVRPRRKPTGAVPSQQSKADLRAYSGDTPTPYKSRKHSGLSYDESNAIPSYNAVVATGVATAKVYSEAQKAYADTNDPLYTFFVGASGAVNDIGPTVSQSTGVVKDVMYATGVSDEAPSSWVADHPYPTPPGVSVPINDPRDPRSERMKPAPRGSHPYWLP
jgi:hypothetical protein